MSAIDFRALLRAEREEHRHRRSNIKKACSSRDEVPRHVYVEEGEKEEMEETGASNGVAESSAEIVLPKLASIVDGVVSTETMSEYPDGLRYYDDFLSNEQHSELFKLVVADKDGWHMLTHSQRRVKIVDARGAHYPNNRIPGYARSLFSAVSGLFPADRQPNHILINEYSPYTGIDGHTDGPSYHPLTVTVSLNSLSARFVRRASRDVRDRHARPRAHLRRPPQTRICPRLRGRLLHRHAPCDSFRKQRRRRVKDDAEDDQRPSVAPLPSRASDFSDDPPQVFMTVYLFIRVPCSLSIYLVKYCDLQF